MWDVEVEMHEPSSEGRAFDHLALAAMFDRSLGEFAGDLAEYIEIEGPKEGATYATGADWAKEKDWTIIVTLRTDVEPVRVVAWVRLGRMPYPVMVKHYDDRLSRYGGASAHDATGVGVSVHDSIEHDTEGVTLSGARRTEVISEYLVAIEKRKIVGPFIEWMEREHRFCRHDDLWKTSDRKFHLPDSVCAGALAVYAADVGFDPQIL